MMKVIFTGGKTGGHIFPAVAMATEFRNRFPRSEIVFVGAEEGLETRIVPRCGFELLLIRARGLSRSSYLSNLMLGFYLLRSLYQSVKILNQKKPDLVVGTGGYVSFPVVMLASLMHIPTMIQEQNSYPGVSTRFLAHFVNRVCLSHPVSTAHVPAGDKFRVIGNPVRSDVDQANREDAITAFGLEQDKRTIFIFGGSQGARAVNRVLLQCLDSLKSECQILWQTGERDFSEVSQKAKAVGARCSIHPFIQDMGSAYASADLVISRAGALTLAEITACGKPSILIPYPFAAADHQRRNAEVMQKAGAASVILERELTPGRLAGEILCLLSDESKLSRMAEKSRKLGRPHASVRLVDEMESLLRDKKPGAFRLRLGRRNLRQTRKVQ